MIPLETRIINKYTYFRDRKKIVEIKYSLDMQELKAIYLKCKECI